MLRTLGTKVQENDLQKRMVSPENVDYSKKREPKRRKVSEDTEYQSWPTHTLPVPREVNIYVNSKATDQVCRCDVKPMMTYSNQSVIEERKYSSGVISQSRSRSDNIYQNSLRNICASNATDKLSILTATAEAHQSIIFDDNSIANSKPQMLNGISSSTSSNTVDKVSSNPIVMKANTDLPSQCNGTIAPLPPVQSASGIVGVSSSNKTKQISYTPNIPMTKEQLTAWRREARRVRNRQSAAASRQKIRNKIDELENQVSVWKNKYSEAMQRIARLEKIAREKYPSMISN
jgi:hypothetical protein